MFAEFILKTQVKLYFYKNKKTIQIILSLLKEIF